MNSLPPNPQEQTPTATGPNKTVPSASSSRRRLLKQATLATPAILTLRSGAVMAMSSCDRQNARKDALETTINNTDKCGLGEFGPTGDGCATSFTDAWNSINAALDRCNY
ncbi:hypothetical protein Thiowin_02765 [Thiorhodovibrio winogradskyi]|uniref:Uncharacterized protein n=1 Tax=Thiorhodovibrio winogradskyi TaxID=77007 RepID=A0ABZ0SCE5_9GAMM